MLRTSRLEPACGSTPQGVVDFVHNVRSTDATVIEVPAVQALKSLFAARDRIELDEDLTLTVGINSNVDNLAVLLLALGLDFNFEFFDPVVANDALFPGRR